MTVWVELLCLLCNTSKSLLSSYLLLLSTHVTGASQIAEPEEVCFTNWYVLFPEKVDEISTYNNFSLFSKKKLKPHFRVIILNFRFDTKSPCQCFSATFALKSSCNRLPRFILHFMLPNIIPIMSPTAGSSSGGWPLDCRLKEQTFKPLSSFCPSSLSTPIFPTQSIVQERCLHLLLKAYSAGLKRQSQSCFSSFCLYSL